MLSAQRLSFESLIQMGLIALITLHTIIVSPYTFLSTELKTPIDQILILILSLAVCRRENLSVRNFVVVELARRFGRASSATTTRCREHWDSLFHSDRLLALFIKKSEVRSQKLEVRSQKSGVRSQKSGVRSQKSEVRSQESG
ncbi:MAG: hypothetical protein QME81_14040, partial [bacterium]|nr:hypothetical protein [bacterium]